MVDAHAARAEPIGPGRDVRAELKLELPKLPGGLPMLRTAIRGARHVAGWQQRAWPDWMVDAHAARAGYPRTPIGLFTCKPLSG